LLLCSKNYSAVLGITLGQDKEIAGIKGKDATSLYMTSKMLTSRHEQRNLSEFPGNRLASFKPLASSTPSINFDLVVSAQQVDSGFLARL
jgi:hypothetical protein